MNCKLSRFPLDNIPKMNYDNKIPMKCTVVLG